MNRSEVIGAGILMELIYLSVYLVHDQVASVGIFIAVNAASFLCFGFLVWRLRTASKKTPKALLGIILTFGIVFRLTLVPRTPIASDDIYRYVWDGRVALSGVNPFSFSPDDPRLNSLHTSDLPAKINFPDMRTIYPPIAQVFFYASNAMFGDSVTGMKFLIVVCECCSLFILLPLLRLLALGPETILLYAWCPLPIMYFGLDGHIDALGIPFLLLMMYFLMKNRKLLGSAMLGLAGLAKVIPLFIAPLLCKLESGWKRWISVTIPFLLLLSGSLFYWEPTGGLVESFIEFNKRFEFNGSIFTLVHMIVKSNEGAHLVSGLLFLIWLGIIFFIKKPILEKVFLSFLGFILVSPVVQPWYLTWLAALVPLRWSLSALTLFATSNLSNIIVYEYRKTGVWQDSPSLILLEYLPFLGVAVWELIAGSGITKPLATRS